MKTFYPQRPPKRRKRTHLISGLSLVVFAIVVALGAVHFFAPHVLGNAMRSVAAPLWSTENQLSASLGAWLEAQKGNRLLAEENRLLKSELHMHETAALQRDVLKMENQALKALLNRSVFDELTLAPILRRPPATPYDMLIVDVEGESAVREGNRVVVGGVLVVGEVISRERTVAAVRLFSSPGVETPVLIGASSTSAVAEGLGNGNFLIRMPREVSVAAGDPVLLPGISAHVLGTIAEIESEMSDPFRTVRVHAPFNFQELPYVQIATNDAEIPDALTKTLETQVEADLSEVEVPPTATSSATSTDDAL